MSVRRIRNIQAKWIPSNEVKYLENISKKKVGVHLPRNKLQEVIDFFSNRKFSVIKILNNSLKLAFEKYSTLNRSIDIIVNSQDLIRIKRQIVPIRTHLSTDILNQTIPTYLKRFSNMPAIDYTKRNLFFKLVKRGSDRNKQPPKSDYQEQRSPSTKPKMIFKNDQKLRIQERSQTCYQQGSEDHRQNDAQNVHSEYSYSIQQTSPSYCNKPERYKDCRKEPTKHSILCKKVRKCGKASVEGFEDRKKSAESEKVPTKYFEEHKKLTETECQGSSKDFKRYEQRQFDQTRSNKVFHAYDQDDRKLPAQKADKKESKILSKMDRIMICVQKHSSDTIKSFLPKKAANLEQKNSRCSKDACSNSSKLHEDILPDPAPPKSIHWSEKMRVGQHKKKHSPSICPSPIVFIPHQQSSKKKPKAEISRDLQAEGLQHSSTDSHSCVKYRTKRESSNARSSTQDSYLSRKTRYDDGDKKCFATRKYTKNQTSFVAYKSGSCEKSENPYQVKDVSDSKGDVSSLKYGLSKRPNPKEMQTTYMNRKPHKVKTRSLKKSEETYLPIRKKRKCFKGSGEWKKQKYQVRLKIFKSKNGLDPCLPTVIEVQRNDRSFIEEIQRPRLSPVHREISKLLKRPCNFKCCRLDDITKTKKRIKKGKGKVTKRKKCP